MENYKKTGASPHRSLASFPAEDFVAIMDTLIAAEPNKSISKIMRGRKSHWYHLISSGDVVCPASGKVVSICSYDILENKNPKVQPTYHFNFYTSDWELFTIDHKLPLARGGKDHCSNVQPMIGEINWDKGSDLIYT